MADPGTAYGDEAVEPIVVGSTFVHRREITSTDIAAFAALSQDEGAHHMGGGRSRPIAHRLLTATVPTKIGGDLDFVSRDMCLRFERPVFAGDVVEATVTIVAADPAADERRRITERRLLQPGGCGHPQRRGQRLRPSPLFGRVMRRCCRRALADPGVRQLASGSRLCWRCRGSA
jgi:acyl dehydratase